MEGARVKWKGQNQGLPWCLWASPSSTEPWKILGPRVGQDGIFCLPHWIALNLGYLPTLRQKTLTRSSVKRLWDPITSKPEGPHVLAESTQASRT